MAEKKKEEMKEEEFSIDTLTKRLHEEIPHTAKHVAYDATKWQMNYMKTLEDSSGRIADFRLDAEKAKGAAAAIMGGLRQTVLVQYLLAKDAKYDPKMYNQAGIDAIILSIFQIDEYTLRQELEGKELTPEAMAQRAQQYAQRGARFHRQIAAAPLGEYDNLTKARNYIVQEFHKAGLDVKRLDRVDADTAAFYLEAIKSGDYKTDEFFKQQKEMLKKYEPQKK